MSRRAKRSIPTLTVPRVGKLYAERFLSDLVQSLRDLTSNKAQSSFAHIEQAPPQDASVRRILDLKGISKTFAGKPALTEVTLYLNEGEVVGLVGENGAGKSTLLENH